jgi:signal peptidase II
MIQPVYTSPTVPPSILPWFRHPSLWLAVGLVAVDLGAKHWVVGHVPLHVAPYPLIPFILAITHQTNTGVAFSWLSHWPPGGILALGAVLQVALAVAWFKHVPNRGLAPWGLALGLAGALGNWLDRLPDAQVTDYLHFAFLPSFPVMNLADWYLSVGVALLAIELLASPSPSARSR